MFSNRPIKFIGRKEAQEQERNQLDNVVARRFYIIIGVVIVIASIFALRLFYMQVNKSDFYSAKLEQYSTNTFEVDALRGEIVDRNYNKLVYNENVVCATYYAVKGIKDDEIKSMVNFLTKNCNIDISSVTEREKKDYLIMKDKKFAKSLVSEAEKKALATNDDGDTEYYNLQLKRITKSVLEKHLSDDDVRYYKLYYTIKNCKNGSAVLLENISYQEASVIGENNDLLRGIQVTSDWKRAYTDESTLKSTLGKVTTKKQGLPATLKDELLALDYSNDSRVGTSGLERQYEDILSGNKSVMTLKYASDGTPIVKTKKQGSSGENIQLTIDWDIQSQLTQMVEQCLYSHTAERYQQHIYCIVMEPKTGDIIALVGKEYNKEKTPYEMKDATYLTYTGAYRIGSTMKGAVIYACFKNNIIKANHYETDTSEGLKIAGTKAKHSWNKSGFGNINEVQALAYSSNIYMMKIIIKLAGGHYQYDKPIHIDKSAFTKLRNAAGELGLGVKTGIDLPYEAATGPRVEEDTAGKLLDFSIGQYDTYTPLQLAVYASTLANKGVKVQPHLYKSSYKTDTSGNIVTLNTHKKHIMDDVSEGNEDAFNQIQAGMKAVVTYGTAAGSFAGFQYDVSCKSGTAEDYTHTGNVDHPNHLFISYGPSKDPQVVVAVLEERLKGANDAPSIAKKAFSLYFEKYGYNN